MARRDEAGIQLLQSELSVPRKGCECVAGKCAMNKHTHARAHARTYARTHARTHTHTQERKKERKNLPKQQSIQNTKG